MRCLLSAFGLVLFVLLPVSSAEKKVDKVAYEVYGYPYGVKNTVKLTDGKGFFVVQDKKRFDEIFGVRFVMGRKPKLVNDKLFKDNLIVTAIKSGSTLWKYEVESVRVEKKKLIVKYKAAGTASSAKYTVPLILSVPRGEYTEVVFIENGKEAGKLPVKK